MDQSDIRPCGFKHGEQLRSDSDATAFLLVVEHDEHGTLYFGPVRDYQKALELAKRVERNGIEDWSIESLQPHRWLREWGL